MAAEVAAFISECQPVAQRFLRTLNRDLAGRGAALLALFALFLAVASWLSDDRRPRSARSEEHTSELQSLMRISYAVFCLKKKKNQHKLFILTHTCPYTCDTSIT